MPRLGSTSGGGDGDGSGSGHNRREASAYPASLRSSSLTISKVIIMLFCAMILRNVFFNDYRKEEIKDLEDAGMSKEDIERLVGYTSKERRKTERQKLTEYVQLKEDVETLKNQIAELRHEVLGIPLPTNETTTTTTPTTTNKLRASNKKNDTTKMTT